MEFSNDGGLMCGIVLIVLSAYYYLEGNPAYTAYNFWISFLASIFQMVCSLVGLNATVKGLGGPTSAIL